MRVKHKVFANMYQDSVSLMQISAQINKLPGIEQASVVMGTETNLIQLRDAGLDNGCQAGPNDLIIAVRGDDEACDNALSLAEERLKSKPDESHHAGEFRLTLTSLSMAKEAAEDANLALISVPGNYAAAEAIKALNLGMNVMLFSDNVSMAHEKQIKELAKSKGLLVMGPDCGTAIINGLPLGFANVIKRGAIGVVAASGTGLQEVSCRIDQLGGGISQALGTGGHDLHEDIGGISMLFGLEALANDPDTQVIVLISKPPALPVAQRILQAAQNAGKPVVVNFLGADTALTQTTGITFAHTLADAAEMAVALLNKASIPDSVAHITDEDKAILTRESSRLSAQRRDIRGVFAGGTFCYETQLLCKQHGFTASSNAPIAGNIKLTDIWHSQGNTIVDMGDDDFTNGRPHPMIDPTLRNQRIQEELSDPHTAVVLFDLVLGYGASLEPADELIEIIRQVREKVGADNLPLLIAHVCGTETDPQVRSRQIENLRQANVLVAGCNAQAALWASYVAQKQAQK